MVLHTSVEVYTSVEHDPDRLSGGYCASVYAGSISEVPPRTAPLGAALIYARRCALFTLAGIAGDRFLGSDLHLLVEAWADRLKILGRLRRGCCCGSDLNRAPFAGR
jgi:hypothetical protein